jgi:DnaK suppressor protein
MRRAAVHRIRPGASRTGFPVVGRTSYVTNTVHDPIEVLRNRLEKQFQLRTDQLSELVICTQETHRGGYDEETLIALIVSSRQALADIADALRRMAEDTYGTCKRCAVSIPLERLEILPQARFCVACQPIQVA